MDPITLVSFEGSPRSSKLEEVQKFFVDSLRSFDATSITLPEGHRSHSISSIDDLKQASILKLKYAFEILKHPVFYEERSVELEDGTFVHGTQLEPLDQYAASRKGSLNIEVYFTEDGDQVLSWRTRIEGRVNPTPQGESKDFTEYVYALFSSVSQ